MYRTERKYRNRNKQNRILLHKYFKKIEEKENSDKHNLTINTSTNNLE